MGPIWGSIDLYVWYQYSMNRVSVCVPVGEGQSKEPTLTPLILYYIYTGPSSITINIFMNFLFLSFLDFFAVTFLQRSKTCKICQTFLQQNLIWWIIAWLVWACTKFSIIVIVIISISMLSIACMSSVLLWFHCFHSYCFVLYNNKLLLILYILIV